MSSFPTRITFKGIFAKPSIIEQVYGYKKYPLDILHSGVSLLKLTDLKIVTESKVKTFDLKGGSIVFSTDVNVDANLSGKFYNKLKSWFERKLETYSNRLHKYKKLQTAISREVQQMRQSDGTDASEFGGFTLGNFFKGRYTDNHGNIYNESSISIEILGISQELLELIASGIAKEFHQETVLVCDYMTNEFYLENEE